MGTTNSEKFTARIQEEGFQLHNDSNQIGTAIEISKKTGQVVLGTTIDVANIKEAEFGTVSIALNDLVDGTRELILASSQPILVTLRHNYSNRLVDDADPELDPERLDQLITDVNEGFHLHVVGTTASIVGYGETISSCTTGLKLQASGKEDFDIPTGGEIQSIKTKMKKIIDAMDVINRSSVDFVDRIRIQVQDLAEDGGQYQRTKTLLGD